MENENKAKEQEQAKPAAEKAERGGLKTQNVGRYIRYVMFLVVIGLVYIWNSHRAETQVRREAELRKQIDEEKAQYKTLHAKLSAGRRKFVVEMDADSLGLRVTSKNIYKLKKD